MLDGGVLLSDKVRGFGWSRLARVMDSKWFGSTTIAWLAVGITIVGNAITYGATVATIQGRVATLEYTVNRNRDEALERIKTVESAVSNIYGSLSTINSIKVDVEVIKAQIRPIDGIKTDVEVIKEQIKSINGAIQRMEIDRRGVGPRSSR